MIPGADHNSRTVLHRRLSSYAELTTTSGDLTSIAAAAIRAEEEEGNDIIDVVDNTSSLTQPLLPDLEYEDSPSMDSLGDDDSSPSISRIFSRPKNIKLWVVFGLLVISGVTNVIFLKLQSVPM